MSENEPSKHSWTGLLLTFFLCLGYVLSPAPVFYILEQIPSSRPMRGIAEKALSPLEYMYNNNATAKQFYDWEFQLFGVH